MNRNWCAFTMLAAVVLTVPPVSITKADDALRAEKKKVVFVAGKPSHNYGAHEHNAGCLLLAKCLQEGLPNIETTVFKNGWPADANAFDGADAIVMYCDGGDRHMVNTHLEEVDVLAKKGVGIVCLHYGVETPAGQPGNYFLDWIGGYFEAHWSVNPHWTAKFEEFPEHPITSGVGPFEIRDEWYFHMRFREGMKGVTPILSDLPPPDTLTRPDGSHSGNPHVRAAVAKGELQHVAWATERPDGGRGFGFTGGHDHWNWGNNNFRKLVLNAIAWSAKAAVPADGVPVKQLTVEELEANQDYEQPKNFDKAIIYERMGVAPPKTPAENNGAAAAPAPATPKASGPVARQAASSSASAIKPAFSSKVITKQTPGHSEEVDVDITGAKQLFLVVNDGGNGFACDWADWVEPRLVGPQGEKKLTDLKWKTAQSDWGNVNLNKNADGQPLRIAGKPIEYGIGTHANSVITFDLPAGYTHFKARAGLDNGGTDQQGGNATSVQFQVYTAQPPVFVARAAGGGGAAAASRDPADAVMGLDVAEGHEVTLFAAEPMINSVANIDIDHRGRVWVCEIVNYRGQGIRRPEGDRIVILEDDDGDGRADTSKVFYQGRDIDSPHGVCVLATPNFKGTRVIVSAGDKVQVFTDEDGDDKPDRKELLFTGISGTQHDHGIHAFTFGPDGKLYFNFGNSGNQIKDKDGKPIVDMAGNEVRAGRNPYQEGMVFRCNLDGSQFETLGWNFRNNWMVTVDSFGTLWQSDNDDDGNRGVRINYVMEFGNYGYKDELTGAGWQSPRTNLETEIPMRHWHLNDPGVVPNLLQTGAGSPTGITVYEGEMLSEVFRDQVIHCDAGPNVCRAYPVEKDGAGYSADSVNVLYGARDNWYRPSDVKVAPDGSLLIADWYDPGVGGHAARDLDSGRIFRVAPPNTPYKTPAFDFATPDGAVEALQNPNYAVRYLAWTALQAQGAKAEPALVKLLNESENARYRARALWLLGKSHNRGEQYVELAVKDEDEDIRVVGVRLARQLGQDVIPLVRSLVRDASPQVRRECAIALRHNKSPDAATLWAELAAQHDGHDRWYLEALGIAADKQWDAVLDAWLAKTGNNWNTPAGRDIIWRSRAAKTPEYLAKIIRDASVPTAELPRYFRAFDFQAGETKDSALVEVAFATQTDDAARQQLISSESFQRLKGFDVNKQPQHAAALNKALDRLNGTEQFVSLVDKFNLDKRYPELLAIAQNNADSQAGVEAMRVLLAKNQLKLIQDALLGNDAKAAAGTAAALGNSVDGRATELLLPLVKDTKRDAELRREATRGAAKSRNGAVALIKMAQAQELDETVKIAAAFQLNAAPWDDVRSDAAKLFPSPPAKNNEALPPITELVKMKGDIARGQTAFTKSAECAKCHIVNNEGKEVGPNLSEIGAKLSRQALLESILYPSAGVSHNYETYVIALDSGNVVTGIMVSQTDDSITLKSADAIVRTIAKSEIDAMKKQEVSLMPADLQKTMTVQDLVDVVEYLTTLRQVNN